MSSPSNSKKISPYEEESKVQINQGNMSNTILNQSNNHLY